MDICGEHGADIAYIGRYCPACAQIEDIKSEHSSELEGLTDEFEDNIDSMRSTIDELEDKLEEANK